MSLHELVLQTFRQLVVQNKVTLVSMEVLFLPLAIRKILSISFNEVSHQQQFSLN
jgi:hypothetical protein